jgi:hypothetical protein
LTVLRDTPITRAISEIDTRSARCNRRISAQSSTPNTCFLPRSTEHRLQGKLVKFRLPRAGQFSLAVDMRPVERVALLPGDLKLHGKDDRIVRYTEGLVVSRSAIGAGG